jgi:hypothetical protein
MFWLIVDLAFVYFSVPTSFNLLIFLTMRAHVVATG